MSLAGTNSSAAPLFILAVGLFGTLLGMFTQRLIARALPRLGGLPGVRTRITTAALTGVLCAALAARFGADWSLPAFLVLAVLSVQLAHIDLSLHVLPNPLVGTLYLSGLVLLTFSSANTADWGGLLRAASGGAALFFVFVLLAVLSPRGIGMGDAKLAAPVGLFLGYLGWSQVFYGGALGFVIGGVVSLLALRRQYPDRPAEVAFGPSLLAAAFGLVLFTA